MTRRVLAVATTAVLLTSGCGVLSGGLRGTELPGGANLGDDPYRLTIEFTDVVDLVPQSLVKVADVPVGTVSDIRVGPDWTAEVTRPPRNGSEAVCAGSDTHDHGKTAPAVVTALRAQASPWPAGGHGALSADPLVVVSGTGTRDRRPGTGCR